MGKMKEKKTPMDANQTRCSKYELSGKSPGRGSNFFLLAWSHPPICI